MLRALEAEFEIDGKQVFPRASIGICLVEPGGPPTNAEELLRNADVAMYMAKRDCKGSYRVFEPAMHERVLERLELRSDLQQAIALNQLAVHYQPIVRLQQDEIYGVEALLRWTHPTRGNITPGPVHPTRRGERPDHPDRTLGAAGGLPRRRDHARPVPPRRAR